MRVLVSGGTGLIGRALVRELSKAGHSCTVLSRSESVAGFPDGVRTARWDATSSDRLAAFLESTDAVVHLAGESIGGGRWTEPRKTRIRNSRVESTRAMVDAIRQVPSPPGVFLVASAVGYYGPRGDETLEESSAAGDDFLARVCIDWEAASEPLEQLPVRRLLARTGLVLSADGGALPKMALPFRLFAGGRAGSGRQWMPWIHLADEIEAMRFLIEHESATGAFNLTAPQPVTNAEFSRALGAALQRPSLMPTPAFVLELALGEMATLILTGQRALPRRLLDLGFEFRYPSLAAALAEIYG